MATRDYYTYGTNLNDREFFTSTVQTPYGIKRYFSNVDSEIYFGVTGYYTMKLSFLLGWIYELYILKIC